MQLSNFIISFAEGLLTFISPCLLPMLPVYIFYLAGVSDEKEIGMSENRERLLINSLGFVLGFTIVFVSLGAAATSIGQFLKSNSGVFAKVSGIIIILFGLHFLGILKLGIFNKEKRFKYKFDKIRFFGSIVFGMVFAFAWSPCMTPFLGSVLIMAGNSETITEGILMLTVYSLGLAVPFIACAIVFERIKNVLRFLGKNKRIISMISGIILIIAGVLVFTNSLNRIF